MWTTCPPPCKACAPGCGLPGHRSVQLPPAGEAGQEFPQGLCVVIGSEGQGLTDATVAACDLAVRIPMTDQVESLNAGVAGSVLLWRSAMCKNIA